MFSTRTQWPRTLNALAAALEKRRRAGLPIIDLTESNPTRAGLRYNPAAVLAPLSQPGALRYEPDPRGLLVAREAVAAYYAGAGIAVDPRQVVLTSGTSEAYTYALRLLANPGDEILCPSPSYPLFDFLAGLNDVRLVHYPLIYDNGWRTDLDLLQARITDRTRALVVVHPNNPTGSYLLASEQSFLADLARQRGFALIVDEVFRDFCWRRPTQPNGDPPAGSTAAVDDCLTLTLNGLSKLSALPQMKLAWMVVSGPRDRADDALARLEVIADTYLSVNTPVQLAAAALIGAGNGVRAQILDRIGANLLSLEEVLEDSAVSLLRATAGWYATLRLPHIRSDEEWALELLRKDGVYLHPGHFFHFPDGAYLVVSLLPEPAVFEAGVARIVARVSACDG